MRRVADTITELNGLALPGYGSAEPLEDVLEASQPAMSVLLASANSEDDTDEAGFRILTSVRGGEQYEYIQWAISVATSEVGHDDAESFLRESEDYTLFDRGTVNIPRIPDGTVTELSTHRQTIRTYVGNPRRLYLEPDSDESRLVTVTRNLLKRKFDLNERAATTGITGLLGSVSLHHVEVGFVGADGESIEYNTNLSIAALVPRELFGGDSSGYLSSSWVEPKNFLEGFAKKNPRQLNPGLSDLAEAYVCNRGMCLRSSVDALGDLAMLREHLDLNP